MIDKPIVHLGGVVTANGGRVYWYDPYRPATSDIVCFVDGDAVYRDGGDDCDVAEGRARHNNNSTHLGRP